MMNRFSSIGLVSRKTLAYAIATLALVFVLVSTQDWIHAQVQGYNFYLNESLLFNTYWLCFLPIALFAQKLENNTNYWKMAAIVLVATTFHLLLYPLLVFVLSSLLFDYTYTFNKVLSYGLSKYVYITLFGYSALFLALAFKRSTRRIIKNQAPLNSIKTIALSKGAHKVLVNTSEIISIQAESPYIKITTSTGNFLHADSLKSMQGQLNASSFIRIHKSSIVNLAKVISIKSRLNGDYDITMENDTVMRLSRNYAAEFKKCFA